MPKKNRPAAVVDGDVFRSFIAEATSLGNEVEARRAFDNDVGAYLAERGLAGDFNAWRTSKRTPKT